MHDPVERQERAARGEGRRGGQDHEGRGDPAEADAARMFVEITNDHGRPRRVTLERDADRIELAAAGGAQETEMHRHHPQGRGRVEIDDHRTPGLVPGEVEPFQPADVDAGTREERIAVPAEADGVRPDGQRLQPGRGGDPVARQGRGPVAQPEVGLLQGEDVGPERGDPGQNPFGIAAQVGAEPCADVPRTEAQAGL